MRIETERLLLREFESTDWQAMLAYWNDERYQRFYEEPKDQEAAVRELLDRFVVS